MRNKGGKKMQAISNKYSVKKENREASASERFNVRVEIARQASRNITALNAKLCDSLLKTMKDMYGSSKR